MTVMKIDEALTMSQHLLWELSIEKPQTETLCKKEMEFLL